MTYSPERLLTPSHPDILDSPEPQLMGLTSPDLVIYDADEADAWLAKHDQSVSSPDDIKSENAVIENVSETVSQPKAKRSKSTFRKARETEVIDGPLCATQDPELFFLERPNAQQTREALSVCAKCLIRVSCLEGAIKRREEFGIWGNVSREQLDMLILRQKKADEKKAQALKAQSD